MLWCECHSLNGPYAIVILDSTERSKMRFSGGLFSRYCVATRHLTAIGNQHDYLENVAVSVLLYRFRYSYNFEAKNSGRHDDDDETQFMRLLLLLLVMNKSIVVEPTLCDKYIAAWYNTILITIKNSQTNQLFLSCLLWLSIERVCLCERER